MKAIDYLKPEIQVITLKAKTAILVGSNEDNEGNAEIPVDND